MGAKRVLVVEDNVDNMILIVDVLKSMGYEVLQANNGEAGLAKAADSHPDLILMDLSLPHMNGWTATSKLKADASLKHIPVIALTAHAMEGDRERALEAGCDDYISKPIDFQILATKLQEYTE